MRGRYHHTTLPRKLVIGPSLNPPHESIRRVLRSDFHKEASPHPRRHNTHTSPFRRPRCGVLWPCLTGNHRRRSGLRRRASSRLLFRDACGLNRYPSFRGPFTDVTGEHGLNLSAFTGDCPAIRGSHLLTHSGFLIRAGRKSLLQGYSFWTRQTSISGLPNSRGV